MLAVAKRRKAGCGLITLLWSSSVSRPDCFEHALDDEHHVRAAGIVFVEDERDVVLQRPGQDAVLELGDLLAVAQNDGVLADEVDARDVAVEVDAHAGPVEPRRDLLDMGRLAGAVIARDHDAAVLREARRGWRASSRGRRDSPGRGPEHARRSRDRPALRDRESMPKTWRTDTFMSGRAVGVSVVASIVSLSFGYRTGAGRLGGGRGTGVFYRPACRGAISPGTGRPCAGGVFSRGRRP